MSDNMDMPRANRREPPVFIPSIEGFRVNEDVFQGLLWLWAPARAERSLNAAAVARDVGPFSDSMK